MSAVLTNQPGPNDRIAVTLLFATALHALLILGIGFEYEPPDDTPRRMLNVEIITVTNPQPAKSTEQADFLAQADQQGGGTEEEKVRPQAPAKLPDVPVAQLPTPEARVSEPEPAPASEPPIEREPPKPTPKPEPKPTPQTLAQTEQPAEPTPVQTPPPPPADRPKRPSRMQLFNSLQREIDRQSAELARLTQNYAKRPRRKVINASTKEYRFASYLDNWRRKVERIGNLNYPEEAKRRKLYGALLLRVSVRADGRVQQIKILRSSGKKTLDDAAVRIVTLAAPFQRFPENIRSEIDVLDIVRTWQFLDTDRLRSR